MTNNRERDTEVESYHILIALRRKKENSEQELCFRQIIRDELMDIELLRTRVKHIGGIWRIYKTINARRVEPARKLLMKKLIDYPEEFKFRVDSLWKSCLLQVECRETHKFLIDVDTKDIPMELRDLIRIGEINVEEYVQTPNGWHIICDKLDTRLINDIPDVSMKRDALKFVEMIK